MAEFLSKGAGLGVGIPALALGGLAFLNQGGLGILNGGTNATSEKDSIIAQLRSEKYTDGAVLDLYKANQAELKERDAVITATLIEEGKQQERINCLQAQVEKNDTRISVLEKEACDNRVNITALNGSINALAADTKSAIALEAERRTCGDDKILAYAQATYVAGSLIMPIDKICPQPKV